MLPIARVAKRLRLCTQALKKRSVAQPDATSAGALTTPMSFIEVTATSAWLPTLLAQSIDDHTTFLGKHRVDRRELTTTMSQTAQVQGIVAV